MRKDPLLRLVTLVVVIVVVVLLLTPMMVFVVDQREMAVVLRFGKPVGQKREPGIQFKLPIIEKVVRLPSTRQFWGDHPDVVLPDLPTKDDKKIEVIPWAIWRVTDPTIFVQRLRTIENAQQRVAQFTRGAIRDVITQYDLAELVAKYGSSSEYDGHRSRQREPVRELQSCGGCGTANAKCSHGYKVWAGENPSPDQKRGAATIACHERGKRTGRPRH